MELMGKWVTPIRGAWDKYRKRKKVKRAISISKISLSTYWKIFKIHVSLCICIDIDKDIDIDINIDT